MASYAPERGDVDWLQFDPRVAHEQAGMRPALVISPRAYNKKVGLALFCPVTSQVKGYPFEVLLPTGLAVHGAVLSDQIKCLDWRVRRAKFACSVPPAVLNEVVARLLALVDPESATG